MSAPKKKAIPEVTPVVVRLPRRMVAALDKAAEANCRTRSSEVRARLQQTLARGAA